MAQLVIAVPGLTPEQYWHLPHDETNALIDELDRQAKERKKGR